MRWPWLGGLVPAPQPARRVRLLGREACETASEFDPQNWWTKWGAILGVAQSPKIQSIKGISEMAMSRLVPLLEFNPFGSFS
jgi:hypothetical protein